MLRAGNLGDEGIARSGLPAFSWACGTNQSLAATIADAAQAASRRVACQIIPIHPYPATVSWESAFRARV